MRVFVKNPSLVPFGKADQSILELSLTTLELAIQDMDPNEIDFLIFTSFSPEVYCGETHLPTKIASALSIKNALLIRTETASSSGASAFLLGAEWIRSGRFKKGVVLAAEIMSGLSRENNNLILGSVLSDSQRRLAMSMAQGGAMITQLYFHQYGYSKNDLYPLAKKLHDNGMKNPNAQIHKLLTEEIYFQAPIFTSPLGLYDISPLSDGAAAIVLTNEKTEWEWKGGGFGTAALDSNLGTSFPSSVKAFHQAYKEAMVSAKDVEVAELHDAFTPFELIGAEDAGLIPRGQALNWVKEGLTHPDNRLPINPSGGLKSRGHPIGVSGLAQIVEILNFQKKQKKRIGLTHSIGGLATNNFAHIWEYLG